MNTVLRASGPPHIGLWRSPKDSTRRRKIALSALVFWFECGSKGQWPAPYQPLAKPQGLYRQTQERASSALYSDLNTVLRAEGPIHTSLAQRARYTSDNAPEGW